MIPMSSARTNCEVAAPPKSSSVERVSTTVNDVVIERPKVCSSEWLTISENGSPAWRARFSRIRSKTTIVSWTLKPMTGSIAGTNRPSNWMPAKGPRIANTPMTTMTSWKSATRAGTPNFTSRNRRVIQPRIPRDPTKMRITACWTRSELTIAPIEDRLACSAIGPKRDSRPDTIGASAPVRGISVLLPAPGAPLADGDAPGLAAGEALGAAAGVALGLALGAADGELAGDAPADAEAPGDPEAPAPEAPGLADGAALGTGGTSRRSSLDRRISMKPRPVFVTVASGWPSCTSAS